MGDATLACAHKREAMLQLVVQEEDRTLLFPLPDGEHIVGSGEDCALRVGHPTVSGHHAKLKVVGERCEVEDLGSRNGTSVAGAQIDEPTGLRPGDELAFGTQTATIESVAEEDLEAAVRFERKPRSEKESTGQWTTVAGARLDALVLDRLPEVLQALEEHQDDVTVATRAAAALYETLPCIDIQAEVPRAGVVFSAKRTDAEPPETLTVEGVAATFRLGFAHKTLANAYRPAVESLARLLALRRGGRGSAPRRVDHPAPPPLPDPPTVDPEVARVYAEAARVAAGDISVLIRGESGTGKELLARYIHVASGRPQDSFVALNCAALPGELLESELFGIEAGVATGVSERPGKFELADGGTLFLDEIGDMAPATQARILRVLQEGEVYRVGGKQSRPARARILAATNRPLDALLESGDFRSDLYHRIADWAVEIPPLRRRRDDIPNLAAHFLQAAARERGIELDGISRSALDSLLAYPWPGNVRQLEREMGRVALFLDDGQMLQRGHLQTAVRSHRAGAERGTTGGLREKLEAVERREISRSLEQHQGNLSAVAQELGIARSTLYRRLKELGLSAE